MRDKLAELRAEYRGALTTTRRALRVPALRRVVLAFGASSAVEAATWLAIGVFAFERSGATAVGVVGLVLLLPAAVIAPAAAAAADRRRRKRILFGAYLAETVALTATAAAIRWDAPAVVVYALAAVAVAALTPIRPAQGAFLPSISRAPSDLTAANVSFTTIRNVGLLVGPLIAGVVLRLEGPATVFAASAVLAALSAVLLWRVPGDPPRPSASTTGLGFVAEGARLLLREERGRLVVALTFGKHVVLGAIRAFLVIVALGLLQMGPGGPALLSAALAVGGVLAVGTAVLMIGRRRLTPALLLGSLLLGLPIIAIGVVPSTAVAIAALVVAGIGRSLIDVAGRTLLGRVSPDHALARFLGMLDGSSYAGLALGSITSALLVHALGIRGALVVAGVFLPVLVLIAIRPLLSIDRGPLVSRDRLQLIMGLPMFAPLGPGSVETLAAQLDPIVADEDAILIRQGDLGDRFYVLERGAAEADVDGTIVATYGPGDGFGEIALLHDVPRTATVRVTEPSRVMALDRTQFLAVLTEEPASMIEAGRLADERILDTQNRRSADTPAVEADDQPH